MSGHLHAVIIGNRVECLGAVAVALWDDAALSGDDAVALVDRLFAERLGGDGVAAVFGQAIVCAYPVS